MSSKTLRRFLIKQPRPHTVRAVGEDGETHTIEVLPNASWSSLAETVHAFRPETVECLDAEGNTLRMVRPEDEPDEPEPLPESVVQIPQNVDQPTQQLLVFAQLLAGAYRHSTDVAFERMVSLFESVNRRSETLEGSLDAMTRLIRRATQDQYDAAAAAANGDDNGIGGLIKAFLQGKAEAEIGRAVAGVANGKTETK